VAFLADLILTVVYLAPRFLIKFFKSTYMPLDKDIVREMWVAGDLKDRLGIRHRKESKNKGLVDLETAPMFRDPHARSASELTMQQGYEPTTSRSPAGSDVSGRSAVDNSPDSTELVASQDRFLRPHETRAAAVSPIPSYYSASDIPPPSPMAPSLYRYPSGEISTQVPNLASQPPVPKLDYPHSASAPAESYELQVRHASHPSHDWTSSPLPSPSRNSPHPPSTQGAYFQPEPLHGYDIGEGRYRPEDPDVENWSGARAL
jgi:phospholipid-translocating ATPase